MAKGNFQIEWVKAQIMEVLKQRPGKRFNHKQISSRLGFNSKEERGIVLDLLSKMVAEKELREDPKGSFYLEESTDALTGEIEFNKRGSGYLLTSEYEPDVHISPGLTWPALNGDQVEVELIHSRRKDKPEGKVVKVLKRSKEFYTGTVQVSDGYGFFVPDDTRSHVDFFIPKNKLHGVKNHYKALVKLTDWPRNAKNPNAEVIRVLGKAGENKAEINAIMIEFGLENSFPDEVLKESEAISEVISNMEKSKRRDFRDTLTFTIDPFDAKDFDDALSVKFLENEMYEIGIHIADVSHFVAENSELDKEAYRRATSVYLVDRVIPMLPERLSNVLCSLRPEEERLCFSVVFKMDVSGKIKDEWFGKTLIYSDKRFSYEEAQQILETGKGLHSEELNLLNKIAKNLKTQRMKEGAISFETEEVKFKLDENGKPLEVIKKVRKDAHKLVEEFMLLANKHVATLVSTKYKPYSIPYRLHEPPGPTKMEEFASTASRFGYKINTISEDAYIESINDMLRELEGTSAAGILQPLAIRSMEKAFYTSKKSGHFGLGFDYYAHFTSPIRRYPDLLTHRYLFQMLEKVNPIHQENLEAGCKWSSNKEQQAVEAERASIKFKQTEYISQFVGEVFDGIITGVTEWGIYVEIIENKCEGMIRLRDMEDDQYNFVSEGKYVIGAVKKIKRQLGDQVRIRVKRTNVSKRLIDLEFV
ncbi:MAG: ribonuclease R [Flavobacteriales bacterium]|nr:ribonuclease R [Flavobacteriales bacterium]